MSRIETMAPDMAPDKLAELQQKVEMTREKLADTVSALADKTDVKVRVADAAHKAIDKTPPQVQHKLEDAAASAKSHKKPIAIAAVAAAVLMLLKRAVRKRREDPVITSPYVF